MIHPLFLNLGSGEIFLIVLCIIMFFGADKLPEMVRTFGRGMKEMKNATGELQRELQNSATEIQREMNTQGHVDDLKETVQDLQKRIVEGVNTEEPNAEEPVIQPEEDINNPLRPDESITRKG